MRQPAPRPALGYFPALERAFDYDAGMAALVLLTGYRPRRAGSGLRTD
jgi:hypothetical protein